MEKSKTTEGLCGMLRSRDAMWLDFAFILITPGCVQADLKQGGMVGRAGSPGRKES